MTNAAADQEVDRAGIRRDEGGPVHDGIDPFHTTHDPADPQQVGWRTGMVYCRACGALLRSERGPGTSPRVLAECRPVAAGFREAASHLRFLSPDPCT